ncbi:MAG: tol-pal system protein YbgF [Deltaproteobacteria bacterium]|nr:tol-pal system protein YbgF [Deltaproteobacteria bacterium]
MALFQGDNLSNSRKGICRFLLLVITLGVFGCSQSLPSKPPTQAPIQSPEENRSLKNANNDPQPKKTIHPISQSELIKIKGLENENRNLKERLEKIELQRTKDQEQYQKKLYKVDQTISLMEKNIQDFEKRYEKKETEVLPTQDKIKKNIADTASSAKKERDNLDEKGIVQEIDTPEQSKAIETTNLYPEAKPRSVIKIGPKRKEREHTSPKSDKLVIPPKIDPKESWDDPDLNPPIAPIQLDIDPGAKSMYNKAFKILSQKDYQNAVKAFQEFLDRHPNDQDADNSQFWIGQAYFAEGNYGPAEKAFRKVLTDYKHGPTNKGFKTPDAILMLGKIYLNKNKTIRSRYYFQYLISRYPDSRSAIKAQQEIQSLNSF